MSIINDALKKVQTNLDLKPEKGPQQKSATKKTKTFSVKKAHPSIEQSPKSIPSHPTTNSGPRVLLWTIGVLILLFSAGSFIMTYHNSKKTTQAASPKIPTTPPPQASTQSPRPMTQKQKTPSSKPQPIIKTIEHQIKISGIMEMGNRNVALINNEIYEVGESIYGMKIIDISLDRILVLDDNQIKTFMVNTKNN